MLHYAGPPDVGGVERTIAAHARFLAERGRPVRILAGAGGDPGRGIDTLIIRELGSRGDEIEAVNRELAAGDVTTRFHSLADRVARQLEPGLAGAAVLIAHNVLTLHKNLALTTALKRLHDAGVLPPLIAWCHDFAWSDPLYQSDLHDGRPWNLLREPWDGVRYVAVSSERRRRLAGLLDVPVETIAVVPPGIDLDAFLKLDPSTAVLADRLGLLAADPLLLLPARITRRKNIELAVAITAALRHHGMDPALVVTGPPGPHNPANVAYLAELREGAMAMHAAESVVFLHEHAPDGGAGPPVSDAMIADLFRLADALLFPSRGEGFGIPLLEAGLSGLPIFCSDLAEFDDVAPHADVVFSLDEPADSIARRIAARLRADTGYSLRRRIRLEYRWRAVCERGLVPLLDAALPRSS
jgi:glycosyltransferase involved in cell wall biosynthesis